MIHVLYTFFHPNYLHIPTLLHIGIPTLSHIGIPNLPHTTQPISLCLTIYFFAKFVITERIELLMKKKKREECIYNESCKKLTFLGGRRRTPTGGRRYSKGQTPRLPPIQRTLTVWEWSLCSWSLQYNVVRQLNPVLITGDQLYSDTFPIVSVHCPM